MNEKDIYKIARTLIIKNIMALICFTTLAIVFKIWWIVLFSALFLTSVTTKGEE